jgi:NAD(P)-dependent dehydrogenase (short-subunit alcohol dehydrogenase family)
MAETWAITGANRGMGLEFARQCLAAGDRVIAGVRTPGAAAELHAVATAHPGQLRIESLDTGNETSIAAFAASLGDEPVDVLINNAGITRAAWPGGAIDPAEMGWAAWEETLRINLFAPFALTLALRANLAAGSRRLVVMMSSDLGSIEGNTMGGAYAYRVSKTGLNMVMKGLSIDLKSAGIAVVSMAPGWVRTDMGGSAAHWSAQDSVALQHKVIAGLTLADSGRFINLQGQPVSW